jgi:curved DNA-binding protein CbpA
MLGKTTNILSKNRSINIFKLIYQKRCISFSEIKFKKNYYEILGVSFDADYESIKKSYYKLAKQYHPDINKEEKAIEIFKEIKKAYEVLGDPNMRIAYDIENRFTDGDANVRRAADQRFSRKYGRKIWRGPTTIKNFYYDKWSNFKTPKWSNLNSGMDMKSEYIFRDLNEDLQMSRKEHLVSSFIDKHRIKFYFLGLMLIDLIFLYDNSGLFLNYLMFKKTFF